LRLDCTWTSTFPYSSKFFIRCPRFSMSWSFLRFTSLLSLPQPMQASSDAGHVNDAADLVDESSPISPSSSNVRTAASQSQRQPATESGPLRSQISVRRGVRTTPASKLPATPSAGSGVLEPSVIVVPVTVRKATAGPTNSSSPAAGSSVRKKPAGSAIYEAVKKFEGR
jgi:hypothetical protein